jgi:hypothetical protein
MRDSILMSPTVRSAVPWVGCRCCQSLLLFSHMADNGYDSYHDGAQGDADAVPRHEEMQEVIAPAVSAHAASDDSSEPRHAFTAIVLVTAERSHTQLVDADLKGQVVRLAMLGRRIGIVGVAPAYPAIIRWLPGGVAQSNRLRDANELQKRADALRTHLEENGGDNNTLVGITIVASGTSATEELIMAAVDDFHGPDGAKLRASHVVLQPDSPSSLPGAYTTQEKFIHLVQSRPAAEKFPVTIVASAIVNVVAGQKPQSTGTRRVTVCLIDMDSILDVMPPSVIAATQQLNSGEGLVLLAPIALPDVGEATQMSSVDWNDRLKDLMKTTAMRLGDTKKAVERMVARRQLSDVTVAVVSSQEHHVAALETAIRSYSPSVIAVDTAFRRQGVFRNSWELFRGAEYERLARAHPTVAFMVV